MSSYYFHKSNILIKMKPKLLESCIIYYYTYNVFGWVDFLFMQKEMEVRKSFGTIDLHRKAMTNL